MYATNKTTLHDVRYTNGGQAVQRGGQGFDSEVLAEARQEFDNLNDSLSIPDQRILLGGETMQVVDGCNYERVSDFFTERQL